MASRIARGSLAALVALACATTTVHAHVDALSRPDTYGRAARMMRDEVEGIARSRARGDAKDILERATRLQRLASDTQALAESLAVAGTLSDSALVSIRGASARLDTAATALANAAADPDTAGMARAAERCAGAYAALHEHVPVQYVCPMHCERGKVYAAPGVCPVCGMDLQLVTDDRYRVDVSTLGGKPRAGIPTTLRIRIKDPAGFDVRRLEIVHEKPLHLMVVSEDLSWFAHVHPVPAADGTLSLPLTFPAGGTYTLFHDFTPDRVGMQVVPVEIEVEGPRPQPVPLVVDAARPKRIDGYDIAFTHTALAIDVDCAVSFTLTRRGKPVTDIEPFLGASGHLVMISQDRAAYVHSHPLAENASTGPRIQFNMTFERTGLYRAWGQFKRHGHVITAPFTVEVSIDGHSHLGAGAAGAPAR